MRPYFKFRTICVFRVRNRKFFNSQILDYYANKISLYEQGELARLAEVSYSTFYRFLKTRRAVLESMGVTLYTKKLPPHVVKYLSEEYCIDLPSE